MHNSSQVEKAWITGIDKARSSNGMLPEMKVFLLRYLNEKTASLAYIRDMLKGMEGQLKEDLTAVEKASNVPNPALRRLLKKLEL